MDHVAAILGNSIQVACSSDSLRLKLKAMGASEAAGHIRLPFTSQQELALGLSQLQECGVPFGNEPHGWPPAAVFQELRSKGLVTGVIKIVSWRAPHEPIFGEA